MIVLDDSFRIVDLVSILLMLVLAKKVSQQHLKKKKVKKTYLVLLLLLLFGVNSFLFLCVSPADGLETLLAVRCDLG